MRLCSVCGCVPALCSVCGCVPAGKAWHVLCQTGLWVCCPACISVHQSACRTHKTGCWRKHCRQVQLLVVPVWAVLDVVAAPLFSFVGVEEAPAQVLPLCACVGCGGVLCNKLVCPGWLVLHKSFCAPTSLPAAKAKPRRSASESLWRLHVAQVRVALAHASSAAARAAVRLCLVPGGGDCGLLAAARPLSTQPTALPTLPPPLRKFLKVSFYSIQLPGQFKEEPYNTR